MPRVAPLVPAESDVLCENCGYTLNGLPDSGNCPECGAPIAASSIAEHRRPTKWEQRGTSHLPPFVSTSAAALFRPTEFFRTLATRARVDSALRFARIHWMIASILFATTALLHALWYFRLNSAVRISVGGQLAWWVGMVIGCYAALAGVTKFAAVLTNWEATYRGLRMPLQPVLRGMYYHAAHYPPVALVALLTVVVYVIALRGNPFYASWYLYVLCGEVIVGAAYLFHTYWIAMRNMMYANR